jgi:colanic acid biosynthesis glycosyl transferase WcaI
MHVHFAQDVTPKGPLMRRPGDPVGFSVEGLSLQGSFEKADLARRFFQQREYGRLLGDRIHAWRPDVVLSANAPADTQAIVLDAAHAAGAGFVLWLQDLYSEAVARLLPRRLRFVAPVMGAYYRRVERRLAKASDGIVVITPDFAPFLGRWGVADERIEVIENWAPLDEIAPHPRHNAWAREQGLLDGPVVLYSGTLGMKHDPSLLLAVARRLETADPSATVVVCTQGPGGAWLRAHGGDQPNLRLLPFQPFDRLGEMLGAASVGLAILEADAGPLSVPSKVLSYLAAGLPVVASIPAENLASRTIGASGGGVCVQAGDPDGFSAAVAQLLAEPWRLQAMARDARAWAEQAFDISSIADRFGVVLERSHRRSLARGSGAVP